MLADIVLEFNRYRTLGQKTLDQIPDSALNTVPGETNNSVAMIVRHLGGNLVSRFTEFLTTDGEKSWRNRDAEFETRTYTRAEVQQWYDKGWDAVMFELGKLTESDLHKQVTIRGQALTVSEALLRSLAHTSYHVGQIVLLGRVALGDSWRTLSIARGQSAAYNQNPTREKG